MIVPKRFVPLCWNININAQKQIDLSKFKIKIKNEPFLKYSFSSSKATNSNEKVAMIQYVPIRPLKKKLTTLFIDKDFLNKGQIPSKPRIWPYFIPFFALVINNILTNWTLLNSFGAFALFALGVLLPGLPNNPRMTRIMKFECNNDLSNYYMTLLSDYQANKIEKNYPESFKDFQDWGIFSVQDEDKYQYNPTDIQKKTLSQQEIMMKRAQFDLKLLEKIQKQKKIEEQIKRFELDASKTYFILANSYRKSIKDHDLLHQMEPLKTDQMFNVPFKYLIVRTQFIHDITKRPQHFFMELNDNGELRYQDYLTALGKNYKISLNQLK